MIDALTNTAKTSQNPRSSHAAIVMQGGRVLSLAKNGGKHAEVTALRRCKNLKPGTRMIVVRVKANGELGNSQPCMNCVSYMRKKGVKSISYSTGWSNQMGFMPIGGDVG